MTRCRLSNYLRTERMSAGLSQRELGELLGLSRSSISKMENEQSPTMTLMIAIEIVFHHPAREMFPDMFYAIEHGILMRALVMECRLSNHHDAVSLRKRAHLSALINRLQFNQPLL